MVFSNLYKNTPAAVAFADRLKIPQENLAEAVDHFGYLYEKLFTELAMFGEF
jgi:hypothetical protein